MKVWQGVIIFATGAVSGAVGSLFYLRKEFEKKVEEEVVARERIKTEFSDKENEKQRIQDAATIDSKRSRGIAEREGYSSDNVTAMIRDERTEASRGLKTNPIRRKDVIFSVDENGSIDDSPSEGPADIPYGITSEDFIGTRQEYDKTTLIFYMKDSTLSTEDGDIIQDPEYLIGERSNWWPEVGRSNPAELSAYIRNEKISTDYEILCENKAYTDDWAT